MELLSLYDHALSLRERLRAAGVPADDRMPPTRPRPETPEPSALLESVPLPYLARLIRVRSVDPEGFAGSAPGTAPPGRSSVQGEVVDGIRARGLAGRSRPRSAGAAPGSFRGTANPSPASAQHGGVACTKHSLGQRRAGDHDGLRVRPGRVIGRPRSAPGRGSARRHVDDGRSLAGIPRGHVAEAEIGVGADGDETGWRCLTGGSSADDDALCRNAGVLPREALLVLVERLRKRLEGARGSRRLEEEQVKSVSLI